MNCRPIAALACLAIALNLSAPLAAQQGMPDRQIRDRFEQIVGVVASRRAELKADVCATYGLVDELLRDQFDFDYVARLILRDSFPVEDLALQQQFIEAFYDYLVASYGDLLALFDENTLIVDALAEPPRTDRQVVTGLITFTNGDAVDVQLSMSLRQGRWRIIDVRAGGHSYVRDYRESFRGQIFDAGDRGLVALVERLEEQAGPRQACLSG